MDVLRIKCKKEEPTICNLECSFLEKEYTHMQFKYTVSSSVVNCINCFVRCSSFKRHTCHGLNSECFPMVGINSSTLY